MKKSTANTMKKCMGNVTQKKQTVTFRVVFVFFFFSGWEFLMTTGTPFICIKGGVRNVYIYIYI